MIIDGAEVDMIKLKSNGEIYVLTLFLPKKDPILCGKSQKSEFKITVILMEYFSQKKKYLYTIKYFSYHFRN